MCMLLSKYPPEGILNCYQCVIFVFNMFSKDTNIRQQWLRVIGVTLAMLYLNLDTALAQAPTDTVPRPPKGYLIALRDSLVRKPSLVGASFLGGHLFTRSYRVLRGKLGVQLEGDNFVTDLYQIDMPARQSITGQFNIFGAMSNDFIFKPYSRFWQNMFVHYAIKATWNLVPPDATKRSGVQHHVELGVDFGARYFPVKHAYLEAGVMLQPLAMSYLNLIRIPVPNITFPQSGQVVDEVEVGSFHMYVSALPYVRTGFYPLKHVSLDFTLGYHAAARYLNSPIVSPMRNGSRIGDDFVTADINNLYLNGKPLRTNDFNFNGRMWGVGFTVHFP